MVPPGVLPLRCPARALDPEADHVLGRRLTPDPPDAADDVSWEAGGNPFERFRRRLSAYALAQAHGWSDGEFLDVVRTLDSAVREVDGRGFVETPCLEAGWLADSLGFHAPGALLVKDETNNVAGSHKARHLMGVMLYLQVAERAGLVTRTTPLAIASCGNAALAAAVVARAARWPLDVFVPPRASRDVLARLEGLQARVHTCGRTPGTAGDPCYAAFQRAVADGALPFCCQGSDNGVTIEGGETLAWELVAQASGTGRRTTLDAVFVQVGGGALASALVQGFDEALAAGAIDRLPRFYAVQTAGGYPLARAHDRLVARMLAAWPEDDDLPSDSPAALARALASQRNLVQEWLRFARGHRRLFMWPWDAEPRSIAQGILDDETYDWAAVLDGVLRTGGRCIVVGEQRLEEANEAARARTGIRVDHTGSAGLAGLLEAASQEPGLRGERVAVVFSGVQRDGLRRGADGLS